MRNSNHGGNRGVPRIFLALVLATGWVYAQSANRITPMTEQEAYAIGTEAYIYGFPLVVMDITRGVSTATPAAGRSRAPINQFANMPAYPGASFKDVVRANLDTLYTVAWVDLDNEPIVLSVPDTGGRYYLMPMLDLWTNVFGSPGKRTTGTRAGNFLIVGPMWRGTMPAGMRKTYRSPTRYAWIIGRTQANGPRDYAAVNAIQKEYKLTPLSAWGKTYTPPTGVAVDAGVDTATPPIEQVEHMDGGAFFKHLSLLLKDNPPAAADAPIIAKLKAVGIEPGKEFDIRKVDPPVADGLNRAAKEAFARIRDSIRNSGKIENGWTVPPKNLANFGTDYDTRAGVAMMGLGANLPEDAVYPTAYLDADGRPLDGINEYVLHFAKGQTPPTNAFWSLTMYNADSFFVPNPIHRQHLAYWMPLKYNSDGSLDLYIQSKSPGKDKEANWLPAPASGPFNVTLRNYWPKQAMLDGSYQVPGIQRRP
jgi:hypothetical protein